MSKYRENSDWQEDRRLFSRPTQRVSVKKVDQMCAAAKAWAASWEPCAEGFALEINNIGETRRVEK